MKTGNVMLLAALVKSTSWRPSIVNDLKEGKDYEDWQQCLATTSCFS
jgi:hypothetical protein